jgi:hypothetical protein
MIVLLDTAGIMVTAAAVLCVWLARRLWLYGEPPARRATVTATVVRPVPSPRPLPGGQTGLSPARQIIRGELER